MEIWLHVFVYSPPLSRVTQNKMSFSGGCFGKLSQVKVMTAFGLNVRILPEFRGIYFAQYFRIDWEGRGMVFLLMLDYIEVERWSIEASRSEMACCIRLFLRR